MSARWRDDPYAIDMTKLTVKNKPALDAIDRHMRWKRWRQGVKLKLKGLR